LPDLSRRCSRDSSVNAIAGQHDLLYMTKLPLTSRMALPSTQSYKRASAFDLSSGFDIHPIAENDTMIYGVITRKDSSRTMGAECGSRSWRVAFTLLRSPEIRTQKPASCRMPDAVSVLSRTFRAPCSISRKWSPCTCWLLHFQSTQRPPLSPEWEIRLVRRDILFSEDDHD